MGIGCFLREPGTRLRVCGRGAERGGRCGTARGRCWEITGGTWEEDGIIRCRGMVTKVIIRSLS